VVRFESTSTASEAIYCKRSRSSFRKIQRRRLAPAGIPVWFSEIGLVFGIAKAKKKSQ
jgi:hypothetical protein